MRTVKPPKRAIIHPGRFSKNHLILFGLLFGAVGGYFIYSSFAAGNNGGLTTANIWISPTAGGSCTRSATPVAFNQATSCGGSSAQVLDMANDICRGGDFVGIKGGTYTAAQIVSGSGVSRSSSSVCTMANAQGEVATLGAAADQGVDIGVGTPTSFLTIDGSYGVSCLPGNLGTATSFPDDSCIGIFAPTYTEVSNPVRARWGGENGDSYLTFKHIAVGAFSNAGGETHFTVQYSDIGPEVDQDSCGGNNRIEGDNETWADNFIHDMVATTGTCGSGHHTECVTWDGGNNVLITRNEFKNCFTGGVFAKLVSNTTGSEVSYNAWWNPAHHSMTDDDLDISTGSGATNCGILVSHNSFSNGFETPGNCSGINDDGTNVNASQDIQPTDPRQGNASGGSANVFISTTGSDSTCIRGDQTKPCLTFKKACSIAQAGDIVGVNAGTYAPQTVSSADCPNGTPAAPIIFEPSYATAAIPDQGAAADAPFIGGTCSVNCGGLSLMTGSTNTGGPSNVDFVNFRVQGSLQLTGNQGQTGTGTNGVNIVINHVSTGAIFDAGVTNELVENSNFGPCYNPNDWSNQVCESENSSDFSEAGANGGRQQSSGMFNNDVFHDYHNAPTNTNNGTDHSECYFALDWRNFTIQNSRFYNCEISGAIRVERINSPGSGDQLTIQNNWFGQTIYGDGGGQECQDITWGSNSGSLSNILVRYNTFSDGGGPTGSSGAPDSTTRLIGNLIGLDPNSSCESATPATGHYGSLVASNNIWIANDYGNGSGHVASSAAFNALLTNSAGDATGNYHLASGTSLPNGYVPNSGLDYSLSFDKDNNTRSFPTAAGSEVYSSGGTSSIPGDLNNDGKVDISDLSILASHYKTSDATSDINHDGIVNVIDLSVLLSHYGG